MSARCHSAGHISGQIGLSLLKNPPLFTRPANDNIEQPFIDKSIKKMKIKKFNAKHPLKKRTDTNKNKKTQ